MVEQLIYRGDCKKSQPPIPGHPSVTFAGATILVTVLGPASIHCNRSPAGGGLGQVDRHLDFCLKRLGKPLPFVCQAVG